MTIDYIQEGFDTGEQISILKAQIKECQQQINALKNIVIETQIAMESQGILINNYNKQEGKSGLSK